MPGLSVKETRIARTTSPQDGFRLALKLGIDYSPPILPAIAHGRAWVDERTAGTIGICASKKLKVSAMIQKHPVLRLLSLGLLLSTAGLVGCDGVPIDLGDIIDNG